MWVRGGAYPMNHVSDRNMNLMKEEDCQPASWNFKHTTSSIEMREIREKRGSVAQQIKLKYLLKKLEGSNVFFQLRI